MTRGSLIRELRGYASAWLNLMTWVSALIGPFFIMLSVFHFVGDTAAGLLAWSWIGAYAFLWFTKDTDQ